MFMKRRLKRYQAIRKPIVFAADLPECPGCGEPFCAIHNKHYADCACLGPDNAEEQGYKLVEIRGKWWGIKKGRRKR